jgi:hypothetical protein
MPWDMFVYKVMPLGLTNVRATFQQTISYAFHDISDNSLALFERFHHFI